MHAMRNARAQQSRALSRAVRTTDAHAFFNLFTNDATPDEVGFQLPTHRERLLPPTETLAMFVAQTLSAAPASMPSIDLVPVCVFQGKPVGV